MSADMSIPQTTAITERLLAAARAEGKAEGLAEGRREEQQAMWDALAILGFDTDGDKTPGACVAGMGDDGYRAMFLDHMKQERVDYREALDEIDAAKEVGRREGAAAVREAVEAAIDEYENDYGDGSYYVRTDHIVAALDAAAPTGDPDAS